jgi:hypothetical protein
LNLSQGVPLLGERPFSLEKISLDARRKKHYNKSDHMFVPLQEVAYENPL